MLDYIIFIMKVLLSNSLLIWNTMTKRNLSIALITALLVTGCSSTNGGSGFASALNQFADIISGASPYIQEAEEWEQYANTTAQKGLTYQPASTTETQFVANKMNAEYAPAIDRLAKPFIKNEAMDNEFDQANQNWHFKYNKIVTVKDQQSAQVVGFCVNFDANHWQNGQPTPADTAGNVKNHLVYIATNRPFSTAASHPDIIKTLCKNTLL